MSNAGATAAEGLKKSRAELLKDWGVSPDGHSVARSFTFATGKAAAKFASRVVAFSQKQETRVDMRCEGTVITVAMPGSGTRGGAAGKLDRKQRGVVKRLDRFLSRDSEKAA